MPQLIELFILTLLQLYYLWYIITILVLKFVLILPVFYYYVTLDFFTVHLLLAHPVF